MPFQPATFAESMIAVTGAPLPAPLAAECAAYAAATTPLQKARCVRSLMEALDAELDSQTGRAIMALCACIGQSVIDKALALQREARDLDDLLERLNAVHIGGGALRLDGDVIHAAYERCYCGSVNKTKEPVSRTYCACSCGWYQRLFQALLGHAVEVELLSSIIQGDAQCRFAIHIEGGR